MPRNLVENGFYIAVGNAGLVNCSGVHIYFNLSPEGAVAVMVNLTRQLNEISIPFTFKVLYNPSDYGRYDSGDLYFERSNYDTVRQVLQTMYVENQSHFQSSVPLFTKFLALGLGLAEETDCRPRKFWDEPLSNRCKWLTVSLAKGDNSPEGRMTSIRQHFSQLGIELQRPYLNAKSEDIYTPILMQETVDLVILYRFLQASFEPYGLLNCLR
jgi:hypothetical protein